MYCMYPIISIFCCCCQGVYDHFLYKDLRSTRNNKSDRPVLVFMMAKREEKIDHDLNRGMDVALEIARRLLGKIALVEVAAPAHLGLVRPVLTIELKEFA